MARTREIKKRIGAVRTIRRITKTMQMIATAKFTTAVQRAQAARPYTEKISRLIGEALARATDFEHPLIDGPAAPARCERLLAISSNRGLCGAYNANVLRAAYGHVKTLDERDVKLDLEVAGKKALGFFKFQGVPVARSHIFGDQPEFAEVAPLAERYMQEFSAGGQDAVRIASMHFVSNTRQVPQITQLLPLPRAETRESDGGAARALYEYSPSVEAVLEQLLPMGVRAMMYQAFLDAAVSEQVMRMIAMKAATDNAGELGRTLTRKYNRARQTQITTELMEVIGGAAALG